MASPQTLSETDRRVVAAWAAGQAAAVAHMGAHALGAAAYAVEAATFATPDRPDAVADEIKWQLDHMTPTVRAALEMLPAVGTNRSGPLGPGLLTAGLRGGFISRIQASIAQNEPQAHDSPELRQSGRASR